MTIWTLRRRGTHPDSGKVKIGDPPLFPRKRFAAVYFGKPMGGRGGSTRILEKDKYAKENFRPM